MAIVLFFSLSPWQKARANVMANLSNLNKLYLIQGFSLLLKMDRLKYWSWWLYFWQEISVDVISCFVEIFLRKEKGKYTVTLINRSYLIQPRIQHKVGQDFRITPYINYAYIHCLKKTKDRTILSLWDFSYLCSEFYGHD